MGKDDPHIHVEVGLGADVATRNILASTFGLVGDLPAVVTTGCGRSAPRAMTSPYPASVTCLPCREHAAEHHLRNAELVTRLAAMAGSAISHADARLAAAKHRELAHQFAADQT